MKTFIALFTLSFLSLAQASQGTLESYYSGSDKDQNITHLYLQNNCGQEVMIATRSQNPNEVWETKGYIRVFPGQVVPAGDMINNIYYLNAFTIDQRVKWEGKHKFEIHGRTVRALLVELPKDYSGNWTTVLYCR